VFIEGDVRGALVQARYVKETVSLLLNPRIQEAIREPMMEWARERFDWERFVDQWDGWLHHDAVWKDEVARGRASFIGRRVTSIDSEVLA
jgi:hypothetical protein